MKWHNFQRRKRKKSSLLLFFVQNQNYFIYPFFITRDFIFPSSVFISSSFSSSLSRFQLFLVCHVFSATLSDIFCVFTDYFASAPPGGLENIAAENLHILFSPPVGNLDWLPGFSILLVLNKTICNKSWFPWFSISMAWFKKVIWRCLTFFLKSTGVIFYSSDVLRHILGGFCVLTFLLWCDSVTGGKHKEIQRDQCIRSAAWCNFLLQEVREVLLRELSRYITAVSFCQAVDSDKWPLYQYNISTCMKLPCKDANGG